MESCQAHGRGAAALAQGFEDFDPAVHLAGVLFNNLGSYIHLHFGSRPQIAKSFVQSCRGYRWEMQGKKYTVKSDKAAMLISIREILLAHNPIKPANPINTTKYLNPMNQES